MNRPGTRMAEISSDEALWLLQGTTWGRLIYTKRGTTVVRPARHTWEYGRLIIRTPVPISAIPVTAAYHADDLHTAPGWQVTVTGPAEVIEDPDEAAHYRRTLTAPTHGPHDTVLRLHPSTITGYRLHQPKTRR
ncbi:pyridoxamine 5'-phosphate oxidase family protein [Streptomyces xiamenensis]|uniref:pyridoxamine 5'-phosphate oxidase family protein n=1 Tax=Streptomyces xiamenensis TaxID=408015 RepID=UPI0036E26CDF